MAGSSQPQHLFAAGSFFFGWFCNRCHFLSCNKNFMKREMSSEISGGTFEWTKPPDWPKQIRQLCYRSCLICLGQSGGLVHSIVPPEISLDISLLMEGFWDNKQQQKQHHQQQQKTAILTWERFHVKFLEGHLNELGLLIGPNKSGSFVKETDRFVWWANQEA